MIIRKELQFAGDSYTKNHESVSINEINRPNNRSLSRDSVFLLESFRCQWLKNLIKKMNQNNILSHKIIIINNE